PATGLNFLLNCLQNRVKDLQWLSRTGSHELLRRPIQPVGDLRLEPASLPQNIHVSVHFSSPAAPAALTISPAAVAAVPPPYPAFSIITANAIRLVAGPYGANPTNQLWDGLPDSSAVPVLPAIRQG